MQTALSPTSFHDLYSFSLPRADEISRTTERHQFYNMRFNAVAMAMAAASILVPKVAADVDPVVIKGSKFFYKTNGTQLYVAGYAL